MSATFLAVSEYLPADACKALPNPETLDLIKSGRNLILYGDPGIGNTHLAIESGIAPCNAEHYVLLTSVPRMLHPDPRIPHLHAASLP